MRQTLGRSFKWLCIGNGGGLASEREGLVMVHYLVDVHAERPCAVVVVILARVGAAVDVAFIATAAILVDEQFLRTVIIVARDVQCGVVETDRSAHFAVVVNGEHEAYVARFVAIAVVEITRDDVGVVVAGSAGGMAV